MRNYVEWKLYTQHREEKRLKREKNFRGPKYRDFKSWGWYTQWSTPTLLGFAVIACVIAYVCCYCMDFIQTQLSFLT